MRSYALFLRAGSFGSSSLGFFLGGVDFDGAGRSGHDFLGRAGGADGDGAGGGASAGEEEVACGGDCGGEAGAGDG